MSKRVRQLMITGNSLLLLSHAHLSFLALSHFTLKFMKNRLHLVSSLRAYVTASVKRMPCVALHTGAELPYHRQALEDARSDYKSCLSFADTHKKNAGQNDRPK